MSGETAYEDEQRYYDAQARMILDAKAEEAAKNARCQRCEKLILGQSDSLAAAFVQLRLPGIGERGDYSLCGSCGLSLRQLLNAGVLT